jgi:hypothetical protein
VEDEVLALDLDPLAELLLGGLGEQPAPVHLAEQPVVAQPAVPLHVGLHEAEVTGLHLHYLQLEGATAQRGLLAHGEALLHQAAERRVALVHDGAQQLAVAGAVGAGVVVHGSLDGGPNGLGVEWGVCVAGRRGCGGLGGVRCSPWRGGSGGGRRLGGGRRREGGLAAGAAGEEREEDDQGEGESHSLVLLLVNRVQSRASYHTEDRGV